MMKGRSNGYLCVEGWKSLLEFILRYYMKDLRNDIYTTFDALLHKDSWYTEDGKFWKTSDMLEYIKNNKVKKEKIHLRSMIYWKRWSASSARDLVETILRVNKADIKYPIIIHSNGEVLDWYHRIVKALLYRKEYIRAYRIDISLVPHTEEWKNS